MANSPEAFHEHDDIHEPRAHDVGERSSVSTPLFELAHGDGYRWPPSTSPIWIRPRRFCLTQRIEYPPKAGQLRQRRTGVVVACAAAAPREHDRKLARPVPNLLLKCSLLLRRIL